MNITMSDGEEIYVNSRGKKNREKILIIHGGPGESCITFEGFADFLADFFHIILVDQRGVLRSYRRGHEPPSSPDVILRDFEEIRLKLEIKQWILYGHSFGGLLALRYRRKYPGSISGMILENPSVSLVSSAGNILRMCEKEKLGMHQEIKIPECGAQRQTECVFGKKLVDYMLGIPARTRQRIFHNDEISPIDGRLFSYPGFSEEQVLSCANAAEKLLRNPEVWMKEEAGGDGGDFCPTLLLRDRRDPLLTAEEVKSLCSHAVCKQFSGGGHYLHLTRKEETARAIKEIFYERERRGNL